MRPSGRVNLPVANHLHHHPTITVNTNENVTLIIKAAFNSRHESDFVCKFANEAIKNDTAFPEEFADLFTLEIITRPSGSKYGVLDFA